MSQQSSEDKPSHSLLWSVAVPEDAGRIGLGVVQTKGNQETCAFIPSQDTKVRASAQAATML